MTTDNRRGAAIELRKRGKSIKYIADKLSAAQSSVSIWCRNIELTQAQKLRLKQNTHSRKTIEKRRQARLRSEKAKRDSIIKKAVDSIRPLDEYNLMLIVAALYWAEGAKNSGIFQFSNGDPRMIKLVLKFLRQYGVPEHKFRAYIHIHESLDVPEAEKYWQKITKISKTQFYKTYNKKNISSKGKRNSLPYGVCDIYVMDAKLFYKTKGWAEGINYQINNVKI